MTEHSLEQDQLAQLATMVHGGFVYVRSRDKKIVATVGDVIVKDASLILNLKITCKQLEDNFDNDDYLQKHFVFLDPISCVMNDPS